MKKKKELRTPLPVKVILGVSVVCLATSAVLFKIGLNFVTVSGNSMFPLLEDGDHVISWAPKDDSDLQGFPVCWLHLDSGENVIKRLIGMPGQTVHLIDGDTYVDGHLIMERTTASWDNMIISLGVDEYLFLGDNRADSFDGRLWVPHHVHFKNIRGVVRGTQLIGGD